MKLFLILLMLGIGDLSFAHVSKLYIGAENGQIVLGISGKWIDQKSGAISLEWRNAFGKDSESRNGVFFPAQPDQSKILVSLTALATDQLYSLNLENTAVNGKDFQKTALEYKSGTGVYLLNE